MVKELEVSEVSFEIPLQARCEVILDLDVAAALVTAAENLTAGGIAPGKTFFIGGGKSQG